MKKLLVLALVCAMASLANAGYMLSYEGGAVVLSYDAPLVGGINTGLGFSGAPFGAISYRTTSAPVSEAVVGTFDGETAVGAGFPYDGGVITVMWGDAVTTANAAGMWLAVALPGYTVSDAAHATVVVTLLDAENQLAPVQGASLYLVPEPATMTLLGLGGLLFARRK